MATKNNHTFMVQVKNTENGTWQGYIEWIESKKKVTFRSALEMLRLMDSAINIDELPDGPNKPQ